MAQPDHEYKIIVQIKILNHTYIHQYEEIISMIQMLDYYVSTHNADYGAQFKHVDFEKSNKSAKQPAFYFQHVW